MRTISRISLKEKENAVVVIIIGTDVLNVMKVKLGSITVSEQVKKAEEKRVRLRSDDTKYSKRHKNENIKYFARGWAYEMIRNEWWKQDSRHAVLLFCFVLHIYSVSLSPPVFVLYGMHGAFVGDCVYNMCMVFISLKWVWFALWTQDVCMHIGTYGDRFKITLTRSITRFFFCWNMNMKPYIGSNERKHPLRCIQIFWTESMESTKEKHRHKTQQNACRVNIFTWKPLWKCSFSYVNQSTSVCSTSTQSRMNSHETS